MFDPTNIRSLLTVEDKDLRSLPSGEDDRHEYKSSATKENDLADKIARAASGFWNTGGGLFVAGVDGNGQPDNGVSLTVGRQSRRDWVDQAVGRVIPRASYEVRCVEGSEAGLQILPGSCVLLIGFGPSEIGPHMAPDNRYYIRSGAHTVPANHFLVESILARRHFSKPRLIHVLDWQLHTSATSWVIIELVTITSAPALDVTITLSPVPDERSLLFPIRTTLIDGTHPFGFRFEHPNGVYKGELLVEYHDNAGNKYEYKAELDSQTCIRGWHKRETQFDELRQALEEINRSLQRRHS